MDLKNIILREVSQFQKAKSTLFSLICGIEIQYNYKQYYEKQITLKGRL
jgi:hypothetical protein